MEGTSNEWLVKAANAAGDNTLAILVKCLSEIKDAIGANVADSKPFQDDFKMKGAAWFYNAHTGRRSVAVLVKENPNDVDIRKVAVKTVGQLTSFKINSVEFVFSSTIDIELIGHFEAQFICSNHQHTLKREKEAKEDQDPREARHLTNVEHYKVSAEKEFMNLESYNLHKVGAFSTLTARQFTNERASIADPEWCEAKVHEVCKDAKQVKSVKVIKG